MEGGGFEPVEEHPKDKEHHGSGPDTPELVDEAIEKGHQRLERITLAHAVTALLGGLSVSFGVVALGWTAGPFHDLASHDVLVLAGSLAFPIGFLLLVFGHGELFTENFFVPVSAVLARRGKVLHLLELWGVSLVMNLAGAGVFAWLITRGGVLGDGTRAFLSDLAHHNASAGFGTAFFKAIFAGWLMTLMGWLLLSLRHEVARIAAVWAIGFLIAAGHFNHVVVSSAEFFIGQGVGAGLPWKTWAWQSLLPAVLGNLVGGLVFVTALTFGQAHMLGRGTEARRGATVH